MNRIRRIEEEDIYTKEIDVDTKIHVVSVETGQVLKIKQVTQGGINVITDEYEGPYEVIPKVTDQVLETEMKGMAKDLTVKAVPYTEVSNKTGTTVIIATD